MNQSRNSRSKASAAEPARAAAMKRRFQTYAYALPEAAAKEFVVKTLPSGVQVAFVVRNQAAEKKLKEWAPARIRRAGRIVASERAEEDVPGAGIKPSAYALGSRARAMLQGRKIVEADLEEAGGAFDLEQVQTLLNGISRQAVEKRVKDGSLLAVPGPSNRRRYPAAQFTRRGVVPGLKEVRDALPTRDPWAVLNFLVRPDARLDGRKPIDLLERGEVDPVVSAAHGMGLQGG